MGRAGYAARDRAGRCRAASAHGPGARGVAPHPVQESPVSTTSRPIGCACSRCSAPRSTTASSTSPTTSSSTTPIAIRMSRNCKPAAIGCPSPSAAAPSCARCSPSCGCRTCSATSASAPRTTPSRRRRTPISRKAGSRTRRPSASASLYMVGLVGDARCPRLPRAAVVAGGRPGRAVGGDHDVLRDDPGHDVSPEPGASGDLDAGDDAGARSATSPLLFWAIAWLSLTVTPWAAAFYLLLWALPIFTSFSFFMILRQLVQHGNGDRGWLTNTRVFFVNRLINYAVFPMGQDYHLPHHIFASVPHYRLRELHEFLLQCVEYRARRSRSRAIFCRTKSRRPSRRCSTCSGRSITTTRRRCTSTTRCWKRSRSRRRRRFCGRVRRNNASGGRRSLRRLMRADDHRDLGAAAVTTRLSQPTRPVWPALRRRWQRRPRWCLQPLPPSITVAQVRT